MTPKKQVKSSDDTLAKLIAGASQLVVSAFSAIGTLIAVLEWPLERKIILFSIVLVFWLIYRTFVFGWKKKRSSRKKLPRLLDLYLNVQKRINPEFRNTLLKVLFLRMVDLALIVIMLTIVIAAVIGLGETKLHNFLESLTPTPTPTQTFTPTPSVTPSLTPSPRPISDSLYYMIVYDSSTNMDETFHGEKKWQVARNMLVEIINGLNPRAQYSMVTIGGPDSSEDSPCNDPESLALPFSPRQTAYDYLGGLLPRGGGSFYKAYTLAKNQLEDLPEETIRTLIYITGSSDTCETEDEWTALKNLISFPDSTFGIFSQIIILDEDGIKSQSLADRFNSLSNENINAQAPQSVTEIQRGGVTVLHIVNNVNTYVTNILASLPTDLPTITPTPTITATLRPGETRTVPPTDTRTNTPTITPTFTPFFTKTFTPSMPPPTSSCPNATHPFLTGPGYGGSVTINSPGHCSTGHPPETAIYTSGSYSNNPDGTTVWVLVYAPDGLYYPQSQFACGGAPPPAQGGESWSVDTYLGLAGDPPKWYDIVVVFTDQTASDYLSGWLTTGCSSGFSGMNPGTLAAMNITEKAYTTVQTK